MKKKKTRLFQTLNPEMLTGFTVNCNTRVPKAQVLDLQLQTLNPEP